MVALVTIERGEAGTLVCRQCGQVWITDDTLAQLLEQLVAHSKTHVPEEVADQAQPHIWLR